MLHGSQGRRPPTLTMGEARARLRSAAALSISFEPRERPRTNVRERRTAIAGGDTEQGRNQLSGADRAHLEVRRDDDLH